MPVDLAANNNARRQRLLLVLLVLTLGLWLQRLWLRIEWVDKEIKLGWTEQAFRNPFLAAEKFMRRAGYAAETIRGYALIDQLGDPHSAVAAGDTLVLVDGFDSFTPTQIGLLTDWAENGGTLIATSTNRYRRAHDRQDPLFDYFGISVEHGVAKQSRADALEDWDDAENQDDEDDADSDQADSSPEGGDALPEDSAPGEDDATGEDNATDDEDGDDDLPRNAVVIREDDDRRVVAAPGWGPTFMFDAERDDIAYRSSERGVELVSVSLPRSRFVALSGGTLWTNHRIDEFDHAYLLWLLSADGGKIWFLLNHKAPSLFERLWQLSAGAMVAFMLCVLLWYWRRMPRFGPMLLFDRHTRRNFLEHLLASAELLWRRRQGAFMIDSLRNEVLRRLLARHPHLRQLTQHEQYAAFAAILRLPPAVLHCLHDDTVPRNERDFVEYIRNLQLIRETL